MHRPAASWSRFKLPRPLDRLNVPGLTPALTRRFASSPSSLARNVRLRRASVCISSAPLSGRIRYRLCSGRGVVAGEHQVLDNRQFQFVVHIAPRLDPTDECLPPLTVRRPMLANEVQRRVDDGCFVDTVDPVWRRALADADNVRKRAARDGA